MLVFKILDFPALFRISKLYQNYPTITLPSDGEAEASGKCRQTESEEERDAPHTQKRRWRRPDGAIAKSR